MNQTGKVLLQILSCCFAIAGVFVSSAAGAETRWAARHGLTSAAYQAAHDELKAKGYRVAQVSGYATRGQLRFAALFKKSSADVVTRHVMSAGEYQKTFTDLTRRGYRLTWVSGYAVGAADWYAAVWEKRGGPAWAAKHHMTADEYQRTFDSLKAQGFRPVHISAHVHGLSPRFAAIFEKSSSAGTVARHNMTERDYQRAIDDLSKKGYRLKVVTGYRILWGDYYAAIWEKARGPYMLARHGVPSGFYQNVFDNYLYQGFTPTYISAFTAGGDAKFNIIVENTHFSAADLNLIAAKVKAFLQLTGAPGMSLALAKDGRLVWAAGFGLADTASGEPVGPQSRFRVASVSKAITSIAMMRLVEANPGLLGRYVFGPSGILGKDFPTPTKYRQLNTIKVRHLLTHTAGFSAVPGAGDPMFQHTSYPHAKLIRWALRNGVLARTPGTMYEYSNFGYCLLGRVIEKLSGLSYAAYVKKKVLVPAGATAMELAANRRFGRKPLEVVYYPANAYTLNVTRFDAHGGWIARPSDLLRVLLRADGLSTPPDLITAASFKEMTTKAGVKDKDGRDPNYAFGWGVGGTQWHNGAMAGTAAILAREMGGWAVAGVVNLRSDNDPFAGKLRALLNEIAAGVSKWPSYDLF